MSRKMQTSKNPSIHEQQCTGKRIVSPPRGTRLPTPRIRARIAAARRYTPQTPGQPSLGSLSLTLSEYLSTMCTYRPMGHLSLSLGRSLARFFTRYIQALDSPSVSPSARQEGPYYRGNCLTPARHRWFCRWRLRCCSARVLQPPLAADYKIIITHPVPIRFSRSPRGQTDGGERDAGRRLSLGRSDAGLARLSH